MITSMILVLAITVLMVILIMVDKLPFGASLLLALLLMVVLGVMDIKTVLNGFSSFTIVMLASSMATIAALQKTSLLLRLKKIMFNLAVHGGFKAYVLPILVVVLGCSLFRTGSTAYYVLVIGLLSDLPDSKALSLSRVLMPVGFAAGHSLLPLNTTLQYGIVVAVLQSVGISANVDLVKFSSVNFCLSLGFFAWRVLAYRIMPDHLITDQKADESRLEKKVTLNKQKETITYVSFVIAVVGTVLQSKVGDTGYAITTLVVGVLLIAGVMSFDEIRGAISVPIILMSVGVIGIADALGNTGSMNPVGQTVANMPGSNANPFVLIFTFCTPISVLATSTGFTIGTVYAFASIATATCVNLGLDLTVATAAIVISGWYGHFLPTDDMSTMTMGVGKYKIGEFWKFTILQYFIRLLVLTAGTVILLPMK